MPFIDVSNDPVLPIYYQDCGTPGDPPVVLIHGWPLSHRMWEHQINALTDAGFRCIAYDRRGFGDSGHPWTGYDYNTLAGDLHDLVTKLDLQDVTLVGFSMGGGEVARYFGLFGADRVARAVLVSAVTPFMLKTADNTEGVEQQVFDDMMDAVRKDRIAFIDGFGKKFYGWGVLSHPVSEDWLHYSKTVASFAMPRATQRCITAFGTTDFRPDMAKLTVPTLVVHGSDDEIVPVDVGGKKAHAMLPDSRLEIIDDAPHGLVVTHADETNRLLIDFLRA